MLEDEIDEILYEMAVDFIAKKLPKMQASEYMNATEDLHKLLIEARKVV